MHTEQMYKKENTVIFSYAFSNHPIAPCLSISTMLITTFMATLLYNPLSSLLYYSTHFLFYLISHLSSLTTAAEQSLPKFSPTFTLSFAIFQPLCLFTSLTFPFLCIPIIFPTHHPIPTFHLFISPSPSYLVE